MINERRHGRKLADYGVPRVRSHKLPACRPSNIWFHKVLPCVLRLISRQAGSLPLRVVDPEVARSTEQKKRSTRVHSNRTNKVLLLGNDDRVVLAIIRSLAVAGVSVLTWLGATQICQR